MEQSEIKADYLGTVSFMAENNGLIYFEQLANVKLRSAAEIHTYTHMCVYIANLHSLFCVRARIW